MRIHFHSQPTYVAYRPVGLHIVNNRRRLLSMYNYRLTISLDLWWWSLWIAIDWDTYV